MSHGTWWSQSLSPYLIINNISSLEFFHSPSGQDVLSSPQWTGCGPSLANGACLVSARHPGGSFPVHHPQEAVPKLTMTTFSPPYLGPPPFAAHKMRGPVGDHIFGIQCAPVLTTYLQWCQMQKAYVSSFSGGSTGWFILILYFDLFYFYLKAFDIF